MTIFFSYNIKSYSIVLFDTFGHGLRMLNDKTRQASDKQVDKQVFLLKE